MGRVFTNQENGHLLNQHYLNAMFPLGPDSRVLERNSFMDMPVSITDHDSGGQESGAVSNVTNGVKTPNHRVSSRIRGHDRILESLITNTTPNSADSDSLVSDVNSPVLKINSRASATMRVKDFSRLWQYRNGGTPPKIMHDVREEAQKRSDTW